MRQYTVTVPLMAALLLNACAQDTPTDSAVTLSPETIAAAAEPAPEKRVDAAQVSPALKTSASEATKPALPEPYQGLDSKEISRAEIEELVALQKGGEESAAAFRASLMAWNQQDPASRGPQPTWSRALLSPEDDARIKTLSGKLRRAQIRKRYENLDPKILSKAEAEEMIVLEQAQDKILSEHRSKIAAWAKLDPATRGPRPERDPAAIYGGNPRLIELQGKVQSANKIKHLTERIGTLSATHNISLSESEMVELTALEIEQQTFQIEFSKAMMEAQKESQINGGGTPEELAIKAIPKHLIQRMLEVDQRMKTIRAPLEAAEKSERIQRRLAKLSEESGVPILSGEISETIALTAEKDKIQNRTQAEAIKKWLAEGGPTPNGIPLPSDEDYARIKQIEARLEAISAPMTAAKNAALEADNPSLRQSRLYREKQHKWRNDWRDKKQAGDIPLDTPMTSPSYAEIQDRVQDYGTKLKSRADTVGYAVSDADMKRLDVLNAEMLAIRKAVYEMEADGSSRVKSQNGHKAPAFKTTSAMYKIGLLETKQREILAGLSEAEQLQNGAAGGAGPTTGTRPFDYRDFAEVSGRSESGTGLGAESVIESARRRGIDISESDAEALRAFERELAGR